MGLPSYVHGHGQSGIFISSCLPTGGIKENILLLFSWKVFFYLPFFVQSILFAPIPDVKEHFGKRRRRVWRSNVDFLECNLAKKEF